MSYDLRLSVKVEGGDNLYAVIDEPELNSPTYNLGEMFRACMDWDFEQGEYYNVAEVLPKIQRGIYELKFNEPEYRKYNAKNGWGDTASALRALQSLEECIRKNLPGAGWSWNEIPMGLMYLQW